MEVGAVLAAIPLGESTTAAQAKRMRAVGLLVAGHTYESAADVLGVSISALHAMVSKSLGRAEQANVTELRALENARLDAAQQAIWEQVEAGDLRAVDVFVRLSKHRAAINGLLAPAKVEVALSVRSELEAALAELEAAVAAERVVEGRVVDG